MVAHITHFVNGTVPNFCHCRFQLGFAATAYRHFRAMGCIMFRHGQSKAAATACNEYRFAAEGIGSKHG